MSPGKLATFAAVGWLLMMSPAIARAQTVPGAFCCTSFNQNYGTSNPGFTPQALGCTAIDGGVNSVNACLYAKEVVLGCAENAFACTPSPARFTSAGPKSRTTLKDCACSGFISQPFN
jgi:hypothetical protein